MSLAGKVAIVTGGGRGIGRAIARALVEEGAAVMLAARTRSELEQTRDQLGRDGHALCRIRVTDVASQEDAAGLVAETRSELGRIDILVNNAGIYGPIGELAATDLAEWERAIRVNLLGTVYATHAVLPILREQGGGKIINMAGAGIGGPAITPRISAYAASKAAIVQLTESIAKEVAPWNIQVNAIAPGGVNTEITAAVIAAGPERAGRDFYDRNRKQLETGGDPPELAAGLAVFLASERSGKLTGKLLSAKWDKYEKIDTDAANRSSLYAIRRIDDVLFKEVPRS
jgi:NAD(P)-dependent dehydrogenase (short-subunit alcohol dehydrogenase family)